jgi:hypothetical protein
MGGLAEPVRDSPVRGLVATAALDLPKALGNPSPHRGDAVVVERRTRLIRPAQTIAIWAACVLIGGFSGMRWAQSMQVSIDRVETKINLPGTSVWLVVGMLFFVTRYALGIFWPSAFSLSAMPSVRWPQMQLAVSAAVWHSVGWGRLLWRYHVAGPRVNMP